MLSSTVVPQVQAVFPEGALTKRIRVGLQVQGNNDEAYLFFVGVKSLSLSGEPAYSAYRVILA